MDCFKQSTEREDKNNFVYVYDIKYIDLLCNIQII